ncbi:MAG: M48 family metallopeptidase [Clostridia bacterium]|nr:M48 family metallopeptidase [Clostridia bacterium]
MEYEIIKSKRKTLSICIKKDGSVVVKSPRFVTKKYIDNFVKEHTDWIEKTRKKVLTVKQNKLELSATQISKLKEKALLVLPERIKFYAQKLNVKPQKVVIGNAKSYWGYCDRQNNLNFSCRLMLASDSTIDYVVVHELSHIIHHNHSKAFWNEVSKIIPDYKENKKELKCLEKKYN